MNSGPIERITPHPTSGNFSVGTRVEVRHEEPPYPACREPLEVRSEGILASAAFRVVHCHEPAGHDGRHHAIVDDDPLVLTVGWPTDLAD